MRSATLFFALAAVVASAVAGGHDDHHGHHGHHDHYAHPHYKFSYGVSDKHTGDQKSAQEVRDGGVTKGSYSLVQPDGVLRTVTYIVTPHGGFQAQVHNKGVAHHDGHYGHGHGHGHGHHGHHGHHGYHHGHGSSVYSGLGSPVDDHHHGHHDGHHGHHGHHGFLGGYFG